VPRKIGLEASCAAAFSVSMPRPPARFVPLGGIEAVQGARVNDEK